MKKINWISLLFVACFGITSQLKAQLTVDTTITVNDLVHNHLVGDNVDVFNVFINGVPGDSTYTNFGLFNSTYSNIPIENGIILYTGNSTNAIGPNDSGNSSVNGTAPDYYDADLDSISGSQFDINDVTVLEFDFIPAGEKVLFRYVFSSEEYNEFVCSSFNDAFGFFISGAGIEGPYEYGAMNIAIIPETGLAVTINNLNNGLETDTVYCTPEGLANSAYYIDNENNMDPTATQMDGFSVTLEASADVICGEPYHLKLAVCNVSDGSYDSAVFLESGSFGAIPIVEIEIVSPTDSSLVGEGCTFDFVFTRLIATNADTVPLIVTGTAENGVDFELLPEFILFDSNQTTYTLPITAFYDGIIEGTEDLELSMKFFTCGDTLEFKATAFIADTDPLNIDMGGPTEICNDFLETATLDANVTGGYGEIIYYWTKGSLTGNPVDTEDTTNVNPWVQPPFQSYSWLTVVDECGLSLESSEPYYVENRCPIFAPNIFTPNGDGENEVLFFENMELFPNTALAVFDRWGKLVYETSNYLNDWSPSEKEAEDGNYFWVLTLTVPEYDGNKLNGYVVIRRNKPRN